MAEERNRPSELNLVAKEQRTVVLPEAASAPGRFRVKTPKELRLITTATKRNLRPTFVTKT